MDLSYYYTLLLGAVDALLEIEKDTAIRLSTSIEDRFRRTQDPAKKGLSLWFHERKRPCYFYLVGFAALLVASVLTFCAAIYSAKSPKAVVQPLKINADRVPGEKLEITIDPSKGK